MNIIHIVIANILASMEKLNSVYVVLISPVCRYVCFGSEKTRKH